MNEGAFWSSYTEAIRLLKELKLLKEDNVHKRIPYSPGCSTYSRGKEYREIYQNLVDFRDYDLLLKDDSMFQMSYGSGEIRLLFIQKIQILILKKMDLIKQRLVVKLNMI